jgi:hypothetical protein
VAFVAIPAALLLIEPKRHKRIIKAGFKDILGIINDSIIKRPELRRNILFSAITGTATLTMAWFAQRFFGEINLDLKLYSPVWAILNLSVGLVAFVAYRIEEKLKPTLSIILIAILIPSGYLALSFFHTYKGLLIILIFYLVRGYATPVLKDYIHRITSSGIRATVLSIRNFAIRLIFAITAPFLGWVTDTYSFMIALKMAALIFFLLAGITAILFIKSVNSDQKEKLNPS